MSLTALKRACMSKRARSHRQHQPQRNQPDQASLSRRRPGSKPGRLEEDFPASGIEGLSHDFSSVQVFTRPLRQLPFATGAVSVGARGTDGTSEITGFESVHESEAARTAEEVVRRLDKERPVGQEEVQPAGPDLAGPGDGRPLSAGLRRRFEGVFGIDFSGVRLHTGSTAAAAVDRVGAHAFTQGQNIVFGDRISDPEGSDHRRLLAHELTHVVQQGMGAGAAASLTFSTLSPAAPSRVQAAPRVTNVVPSAVELGVGGRNITATATIAGAGPRLTWSINPGGAPPAGVSVIGSGRRVTIRSTQPPAGAVIGGAPIVIRAAVTGSPGDFSDSPNVMLVQVTNATYTNAPALAAVPSQVLTPFPPNTAEPNRDGIAGNTAVVGVTTAPAGRPTTIAFRRSLGAAIAGNVIRPGRTTGNMQLRITDTATGARLNETAPTTVAGAAGRMADLTVNPVPLKVIRLVNTGALANPYGFLSAITFSRSDATANPLSRIVGEQVTLINDQLGRPPVNAASGGFNPAPRFNPLSAPANGWTDQIGAGAMTLVPGTATVSIDVNRFVGPGVPHLPRAVTLRQEFIYASWQGGGAVFSNVMDRGRHIKSLVEDGPGRFRFTTEHDFPLARLTPIGFEPYVGPPLIVFSNIRATPAAAGATDLAADGAATANLSVTSSVVAPARTANWTVLTGDTVIAGGNPAVLPATATLQAGVRAGTFRLRAADSLFPNRRVDGNVRLVPVRLRNLRAAPGRVPAGTLSSVVSINADPGGRTIDWTVDAAATAAGVTLAPAVTGPGLAMNTTVTRPAGFHGRVTVTATDRVLAVRTAAVQINFL